MIVGVSGAEGMGRQIRTPRKVSRNPRMKLSTSTEDAGLTRKFVALSELARSERMERMKALSLGVSSRPR